MRNLGIYIHIPYCITRCGYCGFHSNAIMGASDYMAKMEEIRSYMNGLIGEIREKAEKYRMCDSVQAADGGQDVKAGGQDAKGVRQPRIVDSIFIGGGTPSAVSGEAIQAVVGAVRESFVVDTDPEITIEVNPGTLAPAKLAAYKACGINRISIGVQSFDDTVLATLGRIHRSGEAAAAYEMARAAGFDNVNLDLMFGVPGQTMESWMETVDRAIELGPEHISFYSLQIEKDTPFYDAYVAGELVPAPDELDRSMYHAAIEKFRQAGYEHYEISNVCKPGRECRHNLKYWSFEEYLGIGESASSFVDGERFTERPGEEFHRNDFEDDTSEFVFTGLRKLSGISKKEFSERFGKDFWEVFGDRRKYLEEFFDRGDIIEEEDVIRLSENGIDISNTIMSMFV